MLNGDFITLVWIGKATTSLIHKSVKKKSRIIRIFSLTVKSFSWKTSQTQRNLYSWLCHEISLFIFPAWRYPLIPSYPNKYSINKLAMDNRNSLQSRCIQSVLFNDLFPPQLWCVLWLVMMRTSGFCSPPEQEKSTNFN